jgi:hypothetical protein
MGGVGGWRSQRGRRSGRAERERTREREGRIRWTSHKKHSCAHLDLRGRRRGSRRIPWPSLPSPAPRGAGSCGARPRCRLRPPSLHPTRPFCLATRPRRMSSTEDSSSWTLHSVLNPVQNSGGEVKYRNSASKPAFLTANMCNNSEYVTVINTHRSYERIQ